MSQKSEVDTLIGLLGEQIESAGEETFELFAQDLPSHELGFISSRVSLLELTVNGRDLFIHQSPSILSSNRSGGTTGAVVWKITPLFAEWITSSKNPLWGSHVLSGDTSVIELGCGISGVIALTLGPKVSRYVLTDQPYVARLVEQNLTENDDGCQTFGTPQTQVGGKAKPAKSSGHGGKRKTNNQSGPSRIQFIPLDWEEDEVTPALSGSPDVHSFDIVLAADCIYNEALVEPFVSTCVDICRLRLKDLGGGDGGNMPTRGNALPDFLPDTRPCICVVAQQLRNPEVLELWLEPFLRHFHVWRVPDDALVPGLRSISGFVVHVGILRSGTY